MEDFNNSPSIVNKIFNGYIIRIYNIVLLNVLVQFYQNSMNNNTQYTIGHLSNSKFRPYAPHRSIEQCMTDSWTSPNAVGNVSVLVIIEIDGRILINKGTNSIPNGLLIDTIYINNS